MLMGCSLVTEPSRHTMFWCWMWPRTTASWRKSSQSGASPLSFSVLMATTCVCSPGAVPYMWPLYTFPKRSSPSSSMKRTADMLISRSLACRASETTHVITTRKKRQAMTSGMAMAGIRMKRISFLGLLGTSGDGRTTGWELVSGVSSLHTQT
ncbi:hypothetical protein EYF80_051967 [Liparis tanakae]|uniref:Uncharacterized protein n=1 Tax=Liparis tanakae TaxID=230148 RepID=A0A4Z2FAR9_9TELE|nr:hypothetical protein EYF80_051967 [Liparis tanakae]